MKKLLLILTLLFGCFFYALACLWDEDTIEMERQHFPSVIELISGKFLRHSPEFYYWRIKDRKEKLNKFPDSLSLYDDLAVSYSKTGAHKKAIEVILKKDRIKPDEYETYANLGTFFLHDGQFQKGVGLIAKAIDINPQAHFGREIYQKYLAEYVLSKMHDGKISLPLDPTFPSNSFDYYGGLEKSNNFYNYLIRKYASKPGNTLENSDYTLPYRELEKAVIGIMGMMKFGNHTSPILLEALGDLLLNKGDDNGARHLAARAYLRASYQVDDEQAEKIYRKKVEYTIQHQVTKEKGGSFSVHALEKLLKEEIKEGDRFYKKIKNDEIKWINSDKDPELAFAEKYYYEPKISRRRQHSDIPIGYATGRYLDDTTIGKIVDFRPVAEQKNMSEYEADSSARKLVEELRSIEKPDTKRQKSFIYNKKNLFFGVLALFIIITGGFWYKKRGKNED